MTRTVGVILAFLLVSTVVAPAAAQAPPAENKDRSTTPLRTYRIDAIVIRGLVRTKRAVIERELLFEEGETTTVVEIRESVQRLRNLGLFRWASFELRDERVPLPDGSLAEPDDGVSPRVLHIEVDERWTLIPFFTIAQGGGTLAISTGAFDINVLGRYLEVGLQYNRFGPTNSFIGWFYDPRFLDQFLFAGVSGAWTNRVRYFFDNDGALDGGYFRRRRTVVGAVNKEWRQWFRTGLSARLAHDSFTYDLVPREVVDVQEARGGLPDSVWDIPLSTSVALGEIDQYDFLREGALLTSSLQIADDLWGSELSYLEWSATARGFLRLPFDSNLGARVGVGTTTATDLEHLFYLGGFSAVRGYVDARFRGSNYWYANAEFRIPSLNSRWLVFQHIAFVDATGIADAFGDLTRIDGASAGVGLRILSPKIYSFVARFDYAFPFLGSGFSQFSFGSQQFF